MIRGEKIKQYSWYIFGLMGVVFFWAGVWDGIGYLSYLKIPWISLVVGLAMLTLSGFIFKGAAPWSGKEKSVEIVLQEVQRHPRQHEFEIKYRDNLKNKDFLYKANKLKSIEKQFLIFLEKGNKERFIPFHRITAVLHKGKTHWRA